jgi:H+/gluconate symporter-like permease
MEQNNKKPLFAGFADTLADIPPLPGALYGTVIRKINRKKSFIMSLWTAAATFIIAASSFFAYQITAPSLSYSPEIVEELVSISSFYNNGDTEDDNESNFENVLYIP